MQLKPEFRLTIGCSGAVLDIAAVILIILKLTGTVTWSWWWIVSPLIVELVIAGVLGVLIVIALIEYYRED